MQNNVSHFSRQNNVMNIEVLTFSNQVAFENIL